MKQQLCHIWNTPWLLSVAAGLMLGISFPPAGPALLQFPAFVLILRLAALCRSASELWKYTYPLFLIWNIITTYWLMLASLVAGIAAIAANAALMVLPLLLIRHILRSNASVYFGSVTIAAIWTAYEFLLHNWEFAWTWLSLANGWANHTMIIQYISLTGYLSVSFWVVTVAALFYYSLNTGERRYGFVATTLLILLPALSLVIYYSYEEKQGETLEVAVVQPNMNSYQDYGGLGSIDELTGLLLQLSDSVRTDSTRLIIWPENAIDSNVTFESRHIGRIRDTLDVWQTDLITGAVFQEFYDDPLTEPQLVFGRQNSRSFNIFNASLHLSPDRPPDVYKKANLVPMVERTPYVEYLAKLDISGKLDWGRIAMYGRGEEANNFSVNGNKTPALVCYDSVFPHWVGEFVRNGATFLTVITNDGWWGNTSGHSQHFAYARLRAIEFRRWVVRSANNGISGIIAPDGRVEVETEYSIQTAFTHNITPSEQLTFYARHGNWFNWLIVISALFGLFYFRWRKPSPVIPTAD